MAWASVVGVSSGLVGLVDTSSERGVVARVHLLVMTSQTPGA